MIDLKELYSTISKEKENLHFDAEFYGSAALILSTRFEADEKYPNGYSLRCHVMNSGLIIMWFMFDTVEPELETFMKINKFNRNVTSSKCFLDHYEGYAFFVVEVNYYDAYDINNCMKKIDYAISELYNEENYLYLEDLVKDSIPLEERKKFVEEYTIDK